MFFSRLEKVSFLIVRVHLEKVCLQWIWEKVSPSKGKISIIRPRLVCFIFLYKLNTHPDDHPYDYPDDTNPEYRVRPRLVCLIISYRLNDHSDDHPDDTNPLYRVA